MNAYELADAIEDWDSDGQWDTPAANMLRQQADRIAELEKQGEPVAWMQMHHKDNIPTKFSPVKVWEDDIPLYTHPVKELTDELFDKIFADGKRLGILETEDRFYKAMQLSDEEIIEVAENLKESSKPYNINFAKAILRKAWD